MSHGGILPQQAAAIVFRRSGQSVQVCLIRRNGSEAWGISKGLIDPGDTQEETALHEAWEEAGVTGRLVGEPIGTYEYEKWGATFTVAVFLMEVLDEQDAWPEAKFRERRWASFEEAAALLAGHPVGKLLDRASSVLADDVA